MGGESDMSISNRHAIVPFISGKSTAMENQRLAKVGYKSTKSTPAKFPSVCASVPMIALPEDLSIFSSLITARLEEIQDQVIKSLYESRNGKLTEVSDEEIGIDSCLSFLAAQSSGDRISVELITKWFEGNVSENLLAAFAEKFGYGEENGEVTEEQYATLEKHVKVYKDICCMLAGKMVNLIPAQIKAIRRSFDLSEAGENDAVQRKLEEKLESLVNAPSLEEVLEV